MNTPRSMTQMRSSAAIPFLLFLILPPAQADESEADSVTVESILQASAAESGAPAMGAVVASSAGVIEQSVVGIRRLEKTSLASINDPFHIGSVTKPLTATVIARLVEAGRIDWNTTAAVLLPDELSTARPEFGRITLAHLLAHEAGVKPMEEDAELAEVPPLQGDIQNQRRQFVRWVLQQEPSVEPMAEYRYSNAHYVIAAAMVEAVTGKSWEELIEEHIFGAFDMRSAGFGWPGKAGEDVPWGHRLSDGSLRPVDPNGEYELPQYFAPAGDIHASLPDMANFFAGVLGAWQGEAGFLDRETLETMMTRRMRGGLGWGVTSAFGYDRVATYSGSADTFLMVIVVIPDADLSFAVVANAFTDDVERAVIQSLREIVALYVDDQDAN